MPFILHRWPLLVLVLFVWLVALLGTRPAGDGGEYLLAAHAFAAHGTPDIRASDAEWLAAREPRFKATAHKLLSGMGHDDLTPIAAVRRSDGGAYFSVHFWVYSLLAAPALAFVELARAAPSRALAAVNALAASIALWALWAHFGRSRLGLAAAAAFVLSGTTFYLAWTGPEALTGAAVVCACVAASRGELGLGCLAAALAATQNASAIFLVPFVAVRARRPWRALGVRDAIFVGLGAILALLPYAFFDAEYGVPSLLARYATDPSLISFERAWSLVFDLNQGLIYGMPGVLVALGASLVLAPSSVAPSARSDTKRHVAFTLLLAGAMAVPTLAVHNWNAGCAVVIRYGYWIAMPLLVLALELAAVLPERRRWALLGATIALGLCAIAANGVAGERYRYLHHTWLARFVLEHAPGAYNPVPEIFWERTLGFEASMRRPGPAIWFADGAPKKLLAPTGSLPRSSRICPDGSGIASNHVHLTSSGWVYLDTPYQCVPHAS